MFIWHRGVQMGTSMLVLIGLISIIVAVGEEGISHLRNLHGVIGTLTLMLLTIQIGLALLRPGKESSYRNAWELSHTINGYALWVMAIVSSVLGSLAIDRIRSRFTIDPVESSIWVVVMVAAIMSASSFLSLEFASRRVKPVGKCANGAQTPSSRTARLEQMKGSSRSEKSESTPTDRAVFDADDAP